MRRRGWLTVISLVAVIATACSDDDTATESEPSRPAVTATPPTTPAPTTTSTTSTTVLPTTAETTTSSTIPAPTTTAVAVPYADHVSEQYAGTANWICHPQLATDECRNLATTVIAPDGSQTIENLTPAADPAFDCFYAYPTTSSDPGPNSDLTFDRSEADTVRAQVARYASVCRVFAPVYRSITLAGLLSASPEAREIAYGDVVDAWRSYVVDQNAGRGVVVIGHSQGAGHLRRLLEEEIGPDPARRALLVAAVLLGSSVPREGLDEVPPCATANDAGCVVSYSSYPADSPPTPGALFGIARDTGEAALCVDPAALLGDDGIVDSVLPTQLSLLGGVAGFETITTPFVRLTDAVRTTCAEANGFGYLAVALVSAPGDVRQLGGLVEQRLGPIWGLHLLDANLNQDILIELVTRQAAAWASGGPP
jgi:hypothetical protein